LRAASLCRAKTHGEGRCFFSCIYDQHHEIVRYARSWQRGQTFGAERFQKELFAQMAAAQRSAAQQHLVTLLGPESEHYLRRLAIRIALSPGKSANCSLFREYGPDAVAAALAKAHGARAFGAEYIANILRQQQVRRDVQPPLRLKDPELNELTTDPLSLAEYDAFILRSRTESCDLTPPETESTQSDDD
jgi:hypothetical protein